MLEALKAKFQIFDHPWPVLGPFESFTAIDTDWSTFYRIFYIKYSK